MASDDVIDRLQQELDEAYDRIGELEVASGVDEYRKRADIAEGRILRLEEENTRLNRENERFRDQVDSLTDRLQDTERILREERTAREDTTDALARMKANFERAEDQLARERQRAADAATVGARAVKDKQYNTVELEKYATENTELREEIKLLNEDLLAYREAVAELKGEIEDNHEDRLAIEGSLRDTQHRLQEMQQELEQLRSMNTNTASTLDEKNEEVRTLTKQIEDTAARGAADTRKATDRAIAAERQITVLQTEMRTIKEQTRVRELEDTIHALRTDVQDLTSQRDELSSLLDAHNSQLESYMREIRELEEGRAIAIEDAISTERKRVESSLKEVSGASDALKQERTRAQELLSQKAEVEHELEDARARLSAYERGYGLEDAVREQERLREAIRRRDADIARLTRTAGGQLDAYDIVLEIARRLADRAGLSRSTDIFKLYPELELRTSIETNSERLRAINNELQRQNDALEEQRMKLLRQLRVHAEQTGDKSLRYFGLSAEQLMLVNEFAENLRDGKVELPVNDRTVELQGEVRRLRTALEDARANGGNNGAIVPGTTTTTTTTTGTNGSTATPAVAEQIVSATTQEVARQHAAMRESLKEVAEENRRLREQVENVLGDASRRIAFLRAPDTGPESIASLTVTAAVAAVTNNATFSALGTVPSTTTAIVPILPIVPEEPHVADMLKDIMKLLQPKVDTGSHIHPDDMQIILQNLAKAKEQITSSSSSSSSSAAASGSVSSRSSSPVNNHVSETVHEALAILQPQIDAGKHIHPDDMQQLLQNLNKATSIAEESKLREQATVAAARSAAQVEIMMNQLAEARAVTESLRVQLAQVRDENTTVRAMMGNFNNRTNGPSAGKTPFKSPLHPSKTPKPSHTAGGEIHPDEPTDFGPRSPAGKNLIRRSGPDGAPMPVEDWAAEVTDARAALVEALEELAAREDEVGKLEKAARDQADRMSTMVAQQTALYREYITETAKWKAELASAKDRENSAIEKLDLLQAKADRLDQITAILEGNVDPSTLDTAEALTFVATMPSTGITDTEVTIQRLRNYVKSLARKLSAIEVAQPILARKYNVLKQEAAAARAGQRTAELSAVEAEAHMRQRILYLELWKKGAESRLTRFTEMQKTWVPGEEQAGLVTKLTELQGRYTDLLAAEGELRIRYTELRSLPHTVSTLQNQVTILQAELETTSALLTAAKEEAQNARTALTAVTSTGNVPSSQSMTASTNENGITSSLSLLQTASRGELITAVTKQQAALNESEITTAALTKKHSIAANRVAELEGAVSALQTRVTQTEDALAEARTQASKASEEKAEAIAKLSSITNYTNGGNESIITAADIAKMRDDLQNLKEERDTLDRELHKARGVADIAADQAAAITGITKDRETEIEELREQLRLLSSRSDDDAIIGVLQHQLLALKGSFHTFLRKHESMRAALQRTRVASTALEVVIDQRAGEVLAVKEDARVKQLALQRVVDDMRGQLRALESGGLTLSQATVFNDSVRRLSNTVDRQAAELEEAIKARHTAEEKAEARALELSALMRTLEDIKVATGITVAAGTGTLTVTGPSANENRDVVRRLIDLNEQLKSAQLGTLRQRRELALLRDETRLAHKRIEEYEANVRSLEERIVAQDTELRRREDEYRRQLRAAVTQAHAEANEAGAIVDSNQKSVAADVKAATTGTMLLKGSSGDMDADSTAATISLESQIAALRSSLEKTEKIVREAREKADEATEKSRARKRRIDFLERQLELHGVDIAELRTGMDDEDANQDDGAYDKDNKPVRRNRPTNATEEKQWKEERDKFKDDAASGMAKMREHYEEEAKRLQKAAQATTASLKDLLNKKNIIIREYQDKLETVRRERDAERTKEIGERERIAQAAYEENRVTIERLRSALRDVQTAPESMASAVVNQQLTERAEALEQAVAERDHRINELQASINGLSSSLSSTQKHMVVTGVSNEAMAHDAAQLLKRAQDAEKALKEGLAVRDRKLKALQLSFTALKKEFVEAEESHASALAQVRASALANTVSRPVETHSSSAPSDTLNTSVTGIVPMESSMKEKLSALVEQVGRMGKEVKALKTREIENDNERETLVRDLDRARAQIASYKEGLAVAESTASRAKTEIARLQQELTTTKMEAQSKLAEALAHGARMGADGMFGAKVDGMNPDAASLVADTNALQKRIRILEVQNAALRSAQAEAAAANLNNSAMNSMDASQLQAMITAAAAAQAKAALVTAQQSVHPPNIPDGSARNSMDPQILGTNTNSSNAPSDARVAWEEQRKLRKKMESLQNKLNDKIQEAETARQSESATATALAKTKAERDALDKRLTALMKKQQSLDAATVAALMEIEPVAALKARVFDLEEELSSLREKSEGELMGEIRRLKGELEADKLKIAAVQAEATEARDRLRQLQKTVGSPTGNNNDDISSTVTTNNVRIDEDRYLAEASLRDKLTETRRQIASLEGALLSKDATVMELQFELESSRQAADRLRKRIAEVTAFATIATRGKPLSEAVGNGVTNSNLSNLLHDPSTRNSLNNGHHNTQKGNGRRETELEEVVTALKRVTEKQKAEIERLRKQVEVAGQAKNAAAIAAAANATANAVALADRQHKEKDENNQRNSALVNNQNASALAELAEATKALKTARTEIKVLQERVASLQSNAPPDAKITDNLRSRLAAAESEARRLDNELKTSQRNYNDKIKEMDSLSARCATLEQKLKDTGNAASIPAPLVLTSTGNSTTGTNNTSSAGPNDSSNKGGLSSSSSSSVSMVTDSNAPVIRKGSNASLTKVRAVATMMGMASRHQSSSSSSSATTTTTTTNGPNKNNGAIVASTLDVTTATPDQLRNRVKELEKETIALKEELSAFDLDFFEEIEDLKYKYAEAAKKCRAFDEYVKLYPPQPK